MKTNYKNLLIIFLVALLGGFIGNAAGAELSRPAHNNIPTAQNVTNVTKESSDLIEAIDKAYPTVVRIETTMEVQNFFGPVTSSASGSGVIISDDGYIITNNHVIEGATKVHVYTSDNTEYEASLVGTDPKTDIAVIKIEAKDLAYASFADSSDVKIGYDVVAIGNPLGTGISVTSGIISALHKEITIDRETMTLFQTNAEINPGNSGGGLFNINGELIGIVNAKTISSSNGANVEGLGYAIPSNTASSIAESLIKDGYVKDRPTLGVTIQEISSDQQGFKKGLYIVEILDGSAAQKAGLQTYDRIVKFNGADITSYTELSYELKQLHVGDEVEMVVIRNNEELKLTIVLGENIQQNKQ